MYSILTSKPLQNRPVCSDCNSYMRVVSGNPFTDGTKEERVVYSCLECSRTLEHVVYPFGGRVAIRAVASAPIDNKRGLPESD